MLKTQLKVALKAFARLSGDAYQHICLVEILGNRCRVGFGDTLFEHVLTQGGVERLQTELHFECNGGKFGSQGLDALVVEPMGLKVQRRNAALGANLLDKRERARIQLKDRA